VQFTPLRVLAPAVVACAVLVAVSGCDRGTVREDRSIDTFYFCGTIQIRHGWGVVALASLLGWFRKGTGRWSGWPFQQLP